MNSVKIRSPTHSEPKSDPSALKEYGVALRSNSPSRSIAKAALVCFGFISLAASLHASAIYQYSVLEGDRRVYLWVPPTCRNVRGLIVAFKNLTEQRWLEDPIVR